MKILITGAGGFIGGHLVNRLIENGHEVKGVDIKPLEEWHQVSKKSKNFTRDMSLLENCMEMTDGVDEVINMACNMGGMGFIENNKALCMLSVLVNTHMLMACKKYKVKKYFFSSSACVYNAEKQKDPKITGLRETDAYPAMPEDGYGWEKLFSERMCRHFLEDYGLDVKVARYHNIYGPNGTYEGGREKAPAALCRKIIQAIFDSKDSIDVWGDGKQTRSFLYIDECVEGIMRLMNSDFTGPVNIGSDEMVTINQLVDLACSYENKKLKKIHIDGPIGVKGRNSDNNLIYDKLGWKPTKKLTEGLEKTYFWIKTFSF